MNPPRSRAPLPPPTTDAGTRLPGNTGLVAWIDTSGAHLPSRRLDAMARRLLAPATASHTIDLAAAAGPRLGLHWHGPHASLAPVTTDRVVVAMNGWLEQEDERGRTIRTRCPRTLADAWDRWGLDLTQHLRGDVSAVIFERSTGVAHLLTDAEGLRPLFWTQSGTQLAVSTHLPALLNLPWVRREADPDQVAEYLMFGTVHAPNTLLPDLRRVRAGHRLRFADRAVREVRWHTPVYAAPGTRVPAEADVVEELQQAVHRAVARRESDAARVGIYLSGGAGSAALLTAARDRGRPLQSLTVTFDDEPNPESPIAGRVAGLLGGPHHTVRVGSQALAAHVDDAVAAMGQPVAHPSVVLQFLLARAAASEVDVVLSGDGADDLFGAPLHAAAARDIRKAQSFAAWPALARWPVQSFVRRSGRDSARVLPPSVVGLARGHGGRQLFDGPGLQSLLLDGLLARSSRRAEVLQPYYQEVDTDPLNAMMHATWRSRLVHDVVPRVERTATAAGVEARLPLLDTEVVRLARLLPGDFKLRRGALPNRWLLRAALRGVLPAPLVERPDRGMPRPLDGWLTGPGRLFFEDRFANLRRERLGLFHMSGLEALRRNLGRQQGAASRMWALIILDTWMRQAGVTTAAHTD